jgi:hypothetical protein
MKHVVRSVAVLFTGLITFGCSDSQTTPHNPRAPLYSVERANGRSAFGFNGTIVTAGNQIVTLTGGGSWDPSTANNVVPFPTSGHGNGSFSCVTDVTVGQLAGCAQGEGVRWDTVQLLQSFGFKCGGVANETKKTATTSDHVIVLQADFYRAGDGDNATFHAVMFVADHDLADDIDGVQNIWIQGVGCGTGIVNFNN